MYLKFVCVLYAMVQFVKKTSKMHVTGSGTGKKTAERTFCYICSNEFLCCSYLRTAVKINFLLKESAFL